MNTTIRRAAAAALALLGLLFLNVNYLQAVNADSLRRNPRNNRLLLETYSRERGALIAGERSLVESRPTNDRLKYLRVYANGDPKLASVFAPVTGFYSIIYGAHGVERTLDEVLSGEDDRLFVRRLSDLITGRVPQGGSATLTIDPDLQQVAARELGNRRGAVVALDPRTGAVLAMVTFPSYDPNVLSSHQPERIRQAYKRLESDEADPLLNRATQQVYPPGSTFKIVTAAAALERGANPGTLVDCPRELRLPQTTATIRNFGGASCAAARVPLLKAFQESYNTSFGALGMQVGADALQEQAEKFGFNGRPDFALPLAESAFPDGINPPQLAQSAIGQFDVRATPLQMALVAAAVANGGRMMAPYVVSKVEAPDLSVLDEAEPRELGRPISRGTADALRQMMQAVVADGTGTRAQVPGVSVAGKTGTAENGTTRSHAWFVGFAPADKPTIALAVIVENGGGDDNATGGRVAAPIARTLFASFLGRTVS